jgi:High-affinity nickel-transport protein
MFGLDERVAGFSDGTTTAIVVLVALLLGLRHASDPDHLTAVTTLIASGRERARARAARLGLTWGLGHATSLFGFGLPVVVAGAYLPERVQSAAETAVGAIIVLLAASLLVRWRRGSLRARARTRTAAQAYGIGLVHGMGGTAGVGVLLLAGIHSAALAVAALGLFAVCTAVSMALLSAGFGAVLDSPPARRSFDRLAPAVGVGSLVFGTWYALGAQGVVPYVF